MAAFGLSLAVFLFWSLLGWAALAALHSRRHLLHNFLLAPAAGAAATLLPVFWLNRLGLPVHYAGPLASLLLLAAAIFLLYRYRTPLPLRRLLPFAAVLFVALLLAGHPLLRFGFDWVSYGNDDMANYVLAAHRFHDYGFFAIPDQDAFLHNRDTTLYYWFMHAVVGDRPGSELLLAWLMSLTRLTGLQVFMPLILSLHLTLVAAAGALAGRSPRARTAALLTCFLVACSSLTTLGVVYQLIAQTFGLALLCAAGALILPPLPVERGPWRYGLLGATVLSALLVVYPEVVPFLSLAFVLSVTIQTQRYRLTLPPLLRPLTTLSLFCALFLNRYLLTALVFIQKAIGKMQPADVDLRYSLFPFYLVPSGLANLWGFLALSQARFPEPWLSLAIAAGALLLILAAAATAWQTWLGQPIAALAAVLLAMSVFLFIRRNDFGLFKLAMYLQPFVLGVLVTAWLRLAGRRSSPLIILGLLGLPSQIFYVAHSYGVPYVQLPDASASRLFQEFRSVAGSFQSGLVVLDTAHVTLGKLQTLYLRGRNVSFPAKDFFHNIVPESSWDLRTRRFLTIPGPLDPDVEAASHLLTRRREALLLHESFDLHPGSILLDLDTRLQPGDTTLIASAPALTLLNRRHLADAAGRNFIAHPWSGLSNHLLFLDSPSGMHYYIQNVLNQPRVSLFQLESDYFFPHASMAGIGRHLLFEVLRPTGRLRLTMHITTSLRGDGANELPVPALIGTERRTFEVAGRGAAHVISPPLLPQQIAGRSFLALDMGMDGLPFPDERSGLMRLYGSAIHVDPRRLVAFARDISLLSEQDYARLSPPTSLTSFPRDLAHPDLEYSGIYEDGWTSERASFTLTQPSSATSLLLRGAVPNITPNFQTQLTVSLDGRPIARRTLAPGPFELRLPVSPDLRTPKRRRVELRFAAPQRLAAPDRRLVTILLSSIGFTATKP